MIKMVVVLEIKMKERWGEAVLQESETGVVMMTERDKGSEGNTDTCVLWTF